MSAPQEPFPQAMLRTSQIVAGALCLGVLIFLGIVLYLVQVKGQGQAPPNGPVVTYVAAAFLAMVLLPALLIPRAIIRNSTQRIARGEWQPPAQGPMPTDDSGKLLLVRQTAMIVRMAMLEGVSFLGCIAYLLEGQPLALGVALAGLVLLILQFPTQGGVQSWLNQQLEEIDRSRLPS